nr:MAG TPA: hypothetical protein [Caudoviricetes sp.]
MIDKETVGNLYRQGYKPKEIAEMLEENSVNIRQCIHRNFKDDKVTHEINRIRDKEILRITRREANNYMSDAEFIKRNKSIYKTNSDGDIVLDRKVSGIVSFDVPRRYSNEYAEKRIDKRIKNSEYRKESSLFA